MEPRANKRYSLLRRRGVWLATFCGFACLDVLAAVVVAIMIGKVAFDLGWPTIGEVEARLHKINNNIMH